MIMQEDAASSAEKEVLLVSFQHAGDGQSVSGKWNLQGSIPLICFICAESVNRRGTSDAVMVVIGRRNHYAREDSIRKSIRSFHHLPDDLVAMMTAGHRCSAGKVMPVFNQVFIQLGTEMTGFSTDADACGNGAWPLFRYRYPLFGCRAG